jgi:hypothetical protein
VACCYTNKEGIAFRVFCSMYIDWGLEITGPSGEELYYSPSALSNESYGHKMNPDRDFVDWEDAQQAAFDGDTEAFIPWESADWLTFLKSESDELLDAYTVICVGCEKTINSSSAVLAGTEFFCAGCSSQ